MIREEFIQEIKENYRDYLDVTPLEDDWSIHIFFMGGNQNEDLGILSDLVVKYGAHVLSYNSLDLCCSEANVLMLRDSLNEANRKCELRERFEEEYSMWKNEMMFISTSVTENKHFENIVSMGVDIVPFILEKIKEKPDNIIFALDKLFPGVVKWNGFITMADACEAWIKILEKR